MIEDNYWKEYKNTMLETDNISSNPSSRQSSIQDLEASLISYGSEEIRIKKRNKIFEIIIIFCFIASVVVFIYFLCKVLEI